MSKKNVDHLIFTNGRSVKRARQDAKKLSKEQSIPLNMALKKIAENYGGYSSWEDAIELLQQKHGASSPTETRSKTSPLATELGITDEELAQLEWETDVNQSNDGHPYNYIVRFEEGCPKAILAKIDALSDFNEVNVSLNAFDEDQAPSEEKPSAPTALINSLKAKAYEVLALAGCDHPKAKSKGYRDGWQLLVDKHDDNEMALFCTTLLTALSRKEATYLLDGLAQEYADMDDWKVFVDAAAAFPLWKPSKTALSDFKARQDR